MIVCSGDADLGGGSKLRAGDDELVHGEHNGDERLISALGPDLGLHLGSDLCAAVTAPCDPIAGHGLGRVVVDGDLELGVYRSGHVGGAAGPTIVLACSTIQGGRLLGSAVDGELDGSAVAGRAHVHRR